MAIIKLGSAFCKVAVHRQFNGHVRVPSSNRFSLGTPQRTRVRSGQKHTMRTAGRRPFVDVSAKQSQASDRVMKIKHALQVLGDTEGPEVDGLRAALKRAETDTKVTPIHTQVKECESFVQRARLHMEELDQKRGVVGASIRDAEMVALKSHEACMLAPAVPPDAEVQRLQELVSQLQGKLDAFAQDPDVPCACSEGCAPHSRTQLWW